MSGAVRTAILPPGRRAPRDLPNLPALRAGLTMPSGVPMRHRPKTLAESIEPFLFWLGGVRGRRPLTLKAYREDLRSFAAFYREAGLEDPRAIRHSHIEFFLAWLQSPGGRSVGTAARHLSTLRSFFKYLVREEVIARDPAAVSFGPKVTRALPTFLTTAEQERVLTALARDRTLRGRRDHAIVATLLLTGLRAEELMSLRLESLDLETGTLRVVNGKGGKDREMPVTPRLRAILRTYLAEVRPARPRGRLYRLAREGRHTMIATVDAHTSTAHAGAGAVRLLHLLHWPGDRLVGRPRVQDFPLEILGREDPFDAGRLVGDWRCRRRRLAHARSSVRGDGMRRCQRVQASTRSGSTGRSIE